MMRIRKYIYQYGTAIGLLALAACSTEQLEEIDLTPGDTPIQLLGVTTRSTGSNTSLDAYKDLGLKLTSRINKNTTGSGTAEYVNYFQNVGLSIETPNGDNKSKLNAANAYYPLSNIPLLLYGHTGEINENNKISLISGKATDTEPLKFDYLVSNGTNGLGTTGSSGINGTGAYATLMTFRHVMTKLEVAIDVTDTDLQVTKPTDIKIMFKNELINRSGKYLITNATGDTDLATDLSTETATSNYELSVGTHYLVPNGKILSGKGTDTKTLLSYLKIDDYIATTDDLEKIEIPKATPEGSATPTNDLILKPGLAYTLTFKIERLKVVEITLKMKEWDIVTGDGSWGCDPYKVKMGFSEGFANTGTNAISKMVFRYTPESSKDTYQYIASVKEGVAEFLTLPSDMTTGTRTADLYTANGLLIQNHAINYTSASGGNLQEFNISLSANGMAKAADGFYEVGTPLQFYNMMTNPGSDSDAADKKKYKLIKSIDISHLPLAFTPPTFPTGAILDGNSYSILHLELEGNGLFTENKGTLKNLHLAFSSIKATTGSYAGGICAVNSGTIEGCINEADIKAAENQYAGGICGRNTGTILACLNTGNIPTGDKIGGICGENASGAENSIKACINAGMLHGSSNHEIVTNIGGVCGYQSTVKSNNAVINACYWLTGTARPVQGNSKEVAIGSFESGITDAGNYCLNTTNMTETKLRTEAVIKLNDALTTSSAWKFEWKKGANGTYKTVWPIPVKNVTIP